MVALVLSVAGFVAACVDQNDLIGPPGSTRLNLAPEFVQLGATRSDPITHIRLEASATADGSVLGELDRDVDPDLEQWVLQLPVDLGEEPVQAQVTVEMMSDGGTVEWSGRIEIELAPDQLPEQVPVQVFRGPLDNLGVTGVTITTPDTILYEGQDIGLDATIEGGGAGATVFWSSLDETHASVDATGSVTALLPADTVLIVAEAGAHADTFRLGIRALPVGVAFDPDSLVFTSIEQTLTMRAFVVDARGDSIPGSPLTIVVDNPSIVQHMGGSLYMAASVGSTTVTATSVTMPTLSATANLRVAGGGGPVGACTGTGTLHTGSITTSQTWTRTAGPHRLSGAVVVDSTAELTIEAGAVVCGAPGSSLFFQNGAHLSAIGTAADPILFESTDSMNSWYGVYLGGVPADTSRMAHVRFQYVDNAIYGDNSHAVVVSDATIRRFDNYALYLYAPGSAIERTTVEEGGFAANWAIYVGTATRIQDLVIQNTNGEGLYVGGNANPLTNVVIRDIAGDGIVFGGIDNTIAGLRIENVGGVGWTGIGSNHVSAASGVRIVGSGSYGFDGAIGDLVLIAPEPADYDSLLGNANDTIIVSGGTLSQDTAWVRPDVDWLVLNTLYFDTTGVFRPMPGARITMGGSGQIYAYAGGTVDARGTAAQPIEFVPRDTAFRWDGFYLAGAGTSWLHHVRIAYTESNPAIASSGSMVVDIDSVHVRQSRYGAIGLYTAGSALRNSVIDTTMMAGYPAVELYANTIWENNVVRGAAHSGVRLSGTGIAFIGGRIEGSGNVGIESFGTGDTLSAALTPRIVGGASYPGRLPIQMWASLLPNAAAIDSVLGNARDTAVLYGGTLRNRTMVAGPALPPRVEQHIYIDQGARIVIQPGLTIPFASGGGITAQNGGWVEMLGTAAAPIHLVAVDTVFGWTGIYLRGTPGDTSWIRHTVVERAVGGAGAIGSTDAHVVIVDSSTVRQTEYYGVYLNSPGSLFHASTVDTTRQAAYASAVIGGGAAWVNSTVRGAPGVGLRTLTPPSYVGGGRIEGSGGVGMELTSRPLAGAPVRIVGGASYPGNFDFGGFAVLYPTLAAQDSLLGNARDTALVAGTLTGDTIDVGPALPWRITSWSYLTTNSRLNAYPGAHVASDAFAQLYAQTGSTIQALGTAAQPIVFTSSGPALRWYGISLEGAPADTSRFLHVLVENVSDVDGGLVALSSHTVTIDSTRIRNAQYRALTIASAGSSVRDVVIDTTQTAGYPAVQLSGTGTLIQRGVIRGAAGIGLQVTGTLDPASVTPRISGSGSYPVRAALIDFLRLIDAPSDQDSLLGNVVDTVAITGGSPITSGTIEVAASLPWRLESTIFIDSSAVLQPQPGATIAGTINAQIQFRAGGTLFADGTETDTITFTSTDPASRWYGLRFSDAPLAPSRIVHALIENGRDANAAVYSTNTHVVQIDSSRIRNSQYRAVWLNSPNSYIARSTVDTTTTAGYPAVSMGAYTLFDNTTVRGAADVGLELYGDSVSLNGGLITGSQIGLSAYSLYIDVIAPEVVPTITGNPGYPARLAPMQLHALAPTSASRVAWLGNARDTLLVPSGGPYVTGSRVVVSANLPWRVTGTNDMNFSGVGFGMDAEPGAFIRSGNAVDWYFRNGATLHALGTAAAPIVFTGEDTTIAERDNLWWGGLYLTDAPVGDTTRLQYVVIEYGRMPEGEIFAASGHVVLADYVHIRHANERAIQLLTAGSRFNYSTVDTTYDGGAVGGVQPAVTLAANTSMIGSRLRGAAGDGVLVTGNFVFLNTCEIDDSADDGVELSTGVTGSVSINNCNLVNNGDAAGDVGVRYLGTGPAINATNNWWGSASGPQGSNEGTSAGNVTTSPWSTTIFSIPAWQAP